MDRPRSGGLHRKGAIFSIAPGHKESVLYRFGKGKDGVQPEGNLIVVNGTMYGTTVLGGAYSQGTLFSITPSGKETILHSFGNGDDGRTPTGDLLYWKGKLYGTTIYGGPHSQTNAGAGVAYSLTLDGTEKVLHEFGETGDGTLPSGGLIAVGDLLYGATAYGGLNGPGTVFSMTAKGDVKFLYSFAGGADGFSPQSGLLYQDGALYGVTYGGGNANSGTMFKLDLSGNKTVLHSFGETPSDGVGPGSRLLAFGGVFYGTTVVGAINAAGSTCTDASGCGTIYSITPDGLESVVHAFIGRDGVAPLELTSAGQKLYGTALVDGRHGAGTAFEFAP